MGGRFLAHAFSSACSSAPADQACGIPSFAFLCWIVSEFQKAKIIQLPYALKEKSSFDEQ
jgi:hypothetical protein